MNRWDGARITSSSTLQAALIPTSPFGSGVKLAYERLGDGAIGLMKQDFLRLPVVSAGAEFLVMGHLMRRNILAYKAPPNNEGYDLICIHPIRGTSLFPAKSPRSGFRSRAAMPRIAIEGSRSKPLASTHSTF